MDIMILYTNQDYEGFLGLILGFLERFKEHPEPLITLVAVLLAWFAFRMQMLHKFTMMKEVLLSLKHELSVQRDWFERGYSAGHFDHGFFDPSKFVFKVDFPAVREVIAKGLFSQFKGFENAVQSLSMFNERVVAFNSAIDNIIYTTSSNPTLTFKAIEIFERCKQKYANKSVDFIEFYQTLKDVSGTDHPEESADLQLFFKRIYGLHHLLHVVLIADRNQQDRLCYLWNQIWDMVKEIDEKSKLHSVHWSASISVLIPVLIVLFLLLLIYA